MSDHNASAYVFPAGTAELRWLGDTSSYFLATGEQTGGSFALVDERANRGESVPLHRHRDDDEAFYVVEGELSLFIGDDPPARLAAGSFAFVPGGVVHGFRIESESTRYLLLTTPRHGEFYRAISLPSQPGGSPPAESVTGERIRAACEEFGIEFVGPLPT